MSFLNHINRAALILAFIAMIFGFFGSKSFFKEHFKKEKKLPDRYFIDLLEHEKTGELRGWDGYNYYPVKRVSKDDKTGKILMFLDDGTAVPLIYGNDRYQYT
jgi:hypothetical protein